MELIPALLHRSLLLLLLVYLIKYLLILISRKRERVFKNVIISMYSKYLQDIKNVPNYFNIVMRIYKANKKKRMKQLNVFQS